MDRRSRIGIVVRRVESLRNASGLLDAHLDATVLRACVVRAARYERLALAEALGRHATLVHTARDDVVTNGFGAALGELVVVVIGALIVGMTFEDDLDLRVIAQQLDDALEFGNGLALEFRLVLS